MNLREGAILQGGKYRIERKLGHGGFGITYLATQLGLNRKVAIKEFFMSEYCNRDADTSHVSVPSEGSKELVAKFRNKFIKEAQTIAEMDNHHIIRIHDVFEDNGTAYYVMEYLPGGDLRSRIPSSGMPEVDAVDYIRQIADALCYIHAKNILHLDIKPSNILFRGNGEAVLIDFGISKHYDDEGGSQTSSTPVGISEGYAPTEQYEREGVASFAASTDIYALGATLYCLLCGSRPPKASIVLNDGLPELPSHVSVATRTAVTQAMQPRRKDRPQSVDAFLALLDAEVQVEDERTVLEPDVNDNDNDNKHDYLEPDGRSTSTLSSTLKKLLLPAVACIITALAVIFWPEPKNEGGDAPVKEEPAAPTTTPLYVTTTPSGAAVYVDGKKVGTTPIEDKEIARGSHKVKLSKDGYEDKSFTRTFGDKPVVLNVALAEKPKPQVQVQSQSTASSASSSAPVTNKINGHEYVDLGLSVKWATCNVGASSPSDYGSYYAWGETTSTKSYYSSSTCKTWEKSMGSIAGSASYDAARAHWGGTWRLPTKAEFQELIDKCSWTWTSQGGHNGYKVTGKNGKSIFLPAAGWRYRTSLYHAGEDGSYWSATPYESDTQDAYLLYFSSGERSVDWFGRDSGHSVRPVSE